jgi:WD40 repeat protein
LVKDHTEQENYKKLQLNNFNFKPFMEVSNEYISFGTTNGLIILYTIFNLKRKAVLGTIQEGLSVLSIDFYKDDEFDYLIAGYSTGNIILWDLKTFMPIKQLPGIFSNAVMFCRFLNNKNNLVASDSSVSFFS